MIAACSPNKHATIGIGDCLVGNHLGGIAKAIGGIVCEFAKVAAARVTIGAGRHQNDVGLVAVDDLGRLVDEAHEHVVSVATQHIEVVVVRVGVVLFATGAVEVLHLAVARVDVSVVDADGWHAAALKHHHYPITRVDVPVDI